MAHLSSLPTFLAQFVGSRPTSPAPFGNCSKTTSASEIRHHMDYFSSKKPSQLDEQDLLDTLPRTSQSLEHGKQRDQAADEMNRVTEALSYLSPSDSPVKSRRSIQVGGGYFSKHHQETYGCSTSSSSLSTPSLESDYSSLSASCSPLSTPLDYSDEYSATRPGEDEEEPTGSPLSPSATPTSLNFGIASRRRVQLPKLEIPPFQLDASYFTKPLAPPRTKPSTFQFDVSPPRRSKTAYSSSLPSMATTASNALPPSSESAPVGVKPRTTSSSWNPEPIDLAGIIGERPGSPTIKFRQKRRDHGFAF